MKMDRNENPDSKGKYALLQLRKIENERAAIEKWDGKLPGVTGGATPFIQVSPKN